MRFRKRKRRATSLATGLLAFAVAAAPLAAGSVHRPAILVVSIVVIVATLFLTIGEWRAVTKIRLSAASVFPAAFVFLTALQLLPLPTPLADRLDPNAGALFPAAGIAASSWRPLSLDPPATQQVLVRSLMAFLVFGATFHLAAKRRGSLLLRMISAAGVAAVVIGLGHRIFAVPKIYGLFPNTRFSALLTGPFINSNHNAEFLELATFVGLACSYHAATSLARIGWYGASVTCAAGALATLSRSSVFALATGATVLMVGRFITRPVLGTPARRKWLPAILVLLGFAAVATSIGALQLLDRFRGSSLRSDLRFSLWRDSLSVLRAHPMGIGREAFDTIYPIYRTLVVTFPVRFSFVENMPLQMLIDLGYLGFGLLAVAAMVPVRELIRTGRHDRVEFALLAAILAVLAHSLTDFGLETLGVLLPFVAVFGTIMGRSYGTPPPSSGGAPTSASAVTHGDIRGRARSFVPLTAATVLAIVALFAFPQRAGRDFDAALRATANAKERRALISEARRAHPLDYYYPLALSMLEPLTSESDRRSPRLAALNQSLQLCSHCPEVHLQIARTLWRLGIRSQALVEWSTAVRDQPTIFGQALVELSALGARPSELVRLAQQDPVRLLAIAQFQLGAGHPNEAGPAIASALEAGAPTSEVALLRAQMKMAEADRPAAEEAVAEARALAPLDSRVALLDAQLILNREKQDAATQALSVVEGALDRDPNNLDLQRKRIEIVARSNRWSASERAIIGFKQALQENGRSTTEANLAAAAIYTSMGRVRDALAEYRIASTTDPTNPEVWRQFGSAAEATRHYVLAREAYTELTHLVPDRKYSEALRRIDDRQATERLGNSIPSGPDSR